MPRSLEVGGPGGRLGQVLCCGPATGRARETLLE